MNQFLLYLQLVISILLIILIMIQSRGTGFARGFSASQVSFARRGLEKLIFRLTFVVTALFILISALLLFF
ncbi:preprotein translocase subunit SecG [Candidatus Woesebacteria bacterium]|nr:preprotein translocase subunit SecG [Candidatus Woesebacteria bacterium]